MWWAQSRRMASAWKICNDKGFLYSISLKSLLLPYNHTKEKTQTAEEMDQEKTSSVLGMLSAASLVNPEGIVSASPIPCEGSQPEK